MSNIGPFAPRLPAGTTSLAVTATAQPMAPNPAGHSMQYRFANVGTQVIFWLAAAPNAALPVATAANGIPMQAGSVETFTLPPNVQLSFIAAATGSTVYVTPGEGI